MVEVKCFNQSTNSHFHKFIQLVKVSIEFAVDGNSKDWYKKGTI